MSKFVKTMRAVSCHAAIVAMLSVGIAALQSATAGPLQLPTWPQKFEITGPESASFGFIMTQPGRVAIDVRASGAPIVASLLGPLGRAAEQSGSGSVRLAYEVTARDLQTSQVWTIRVRLAEPATAAGAAHAGGTVVARYPSVDPAAAQALLDKMAAQRNVAEQSAVQRGRDPQAAAAVTVKMDAALDARRSQLEQQRLAMRNEAYARLQPAFAAAQARLAGQVGTRGLAPVGAAAKSAAPTAEMLAIRPATEPARASVSQADGGVNSMPPPQTVMANPVITSLSVAQGQPGDPVLVGGSGFGSGGEVHFIVGPGKDLVAKVDGGWGDSQVFVTVPEISGVMGYNGQAYLVRAGDQVRSNFVAFQFNPLMEVRELRSTMDRVLAQPYMQQYTYPSYIVRWNENPFAGFWGNDVLFYAARLKNGWLVDDGLIFCGETTGPPHCDGGAYVAGLARKSSSPSMTVHWWVDAAVVDITQVHYAFAVRIVGPKDVPDGVSVP